MDTKILGILHTFFIVNVIGDRVHDLPEIYVQEHCKIFLGFLQQILDIFIQGAHKPEIGLIFVVDVPKNLPPCFPALSVDFDYLFFVKDVSSGGEK